MKSKRDCCGVVGRAFAPQEGMVLDDGAVHRSDIELLPKCTD